MQLDGMSIKQLDALAIAIAEKRKQLVYADRKRVRQLLIDTAAAEGFTISVLFRVESGQPAPTEKPARLKQGTYANPADPTQRWPGRGPRPAWFKAAIAAGTPALAMRIE